MFAGFNRLGKFAVIFFDVADDFHLARLDNQQPLSCQFAEFFLQSDKPIRQLHLTFEACLLNHNLAHGLRFDYVELCVAHKADSFVFFVGKFELPLAFHFGKFRLLSGFRHACLRLHLKVFDLRGVFDFCTGDFFVGKSKTFVGFDFGKFGLLFAFDFGKLNLVAFCGRTFPRRAE